MTEHFTLIEPWIQHIRDAVGNAPLMVPSAAVWIEDGNGHALFQKRSEYEDAWGFLGGNMGWGESAAETAIREVREEAGVEIEITGLVGIYSKYVRTLANGHQCQSITTLFRANIVAGSLAIDGIETFALRYFDAFNPPPFVIPQHYDMLDDARNRRNGVFR